MQAKVLRVKFMLSIVYKSQSLQQIYKSYSASQFSICSVISM